MLEPRITEESVHRHYKVDLPDAQRVYWVTWNRRRVGQGIDERWRCTCGTPNCDHVRWVREWLAARKTAEPAA